MDSRITVTFRFRHGLTSSVSLTKIAAAITFAAFVVGGPGVAKSQIQDAGVYTQHNDNSRTGAQLNETTLTPSAVSSRGMRIVYTANVDDAIWAQPLYVRSVAFPGGSANAVYTVTANNSVYAFDADSGALKWAHPLTDSTIPLRPFAHDAPVTPVIDIGQQAMFVLFSTKNQLKDGSGDPWTLQNLLKTLNVAYWLVALDLRTGAELHRTQVQATVARSDGSMLTFDPRVHESHPALLLDHGSIYVAFGDNPVEEVLTEYHGWVMRFDAVSLQPQGVFCTTVDMRGQGAEGGGVWQGGAGLAADADGNIYFLVGNGDYIPQNRSYGDSFAKLTPAGNTLTLAGTVADVTPPPAIAASVPRYDHTVAQLMETRDLDLGAGGLVVIPGTRMLVGGGKTGMVYLVDGTSMTIQQSFQGFTNTYHPTWNYGCPRPIPAGCESWHAGPHLHGSPTFWNGHLYDWSEKDHLKKFNFDSSTNLFSVTPVVAGVDASPTRMPGGLLSVSANGTVAGSGIVWAMLPTNGPSPTLHAHVYAFDAESLALLWNAPFPAALSQMTRRAGPTVADGKVFVPTANGALLAYGLCDPGTPCVLGHASAPLLAAHDMASSMDMTAPMEMTAPMTHSELAIKHRSQLLPPAGEIVLFRVRAHFDGDAERFEGGDRIGATWKATDGSRVTAELVKTIYATDDDAAPGQLFKVISREGSGRFQRVDWIQRTDAEGGEATYVFYGGKL